MIIFALFLFISCQEEEALEKIFEELPDSKLPGIEKGVPLNKTGLTSCSQLFDRKENVCLIFSDSFERDQLIGQGIFNWKQAIMDNGYSGKNIDVKIETKEHLGHIIDGKKAALFRGRAGGSTHEIYLISKSLDLSQYEQVYIQFRYLPIGLEEEITLSCNHQKVPENIRIDICKESDFDCDLTGKNSHQRIRDNKNWNSFFPDILEYGQQNNIRDFNEENWKLGQFLIDLDDLKRGPDKFVFKVSVSMDEGYKSNNRNSKMEDGLILDDIILVGIKTSVIF